MVACGVVAQQVRMGQATCRRLSIEKILYKLVRYELVATVVLDLSVRYSTCQSCHVPVIQARQALNTPFVSVNLFICWFPISTIFLVIQSRES